MWPHPKLLSQPDADRMTDFRSSENVLEPKSDSGRSAGDFAPGIEIAAEVHSVATCRRIEVAEIVRYEARQQIPFPLED